MKRNVREHLVLEGQNIRCKHCGAMEQMRVPAPLTDWIKQGEAFIGRHKDCKPRNYEEVANI